MNPDPSIAAISSAWWEATQAQLEKVQVSQVQAILSLNRRLSPKEFLYLLSPVASSCLEALAQKAQALTLKRFGRTMQFFIPMYVSNECKNICTYCGFRLDNPIPRKTLTMEEIEQEIVAIKAMGHDTLVILTGEAAAKVDMPYFRKLLPRLRPHFSQIAFEGQPLSRGDYEELMTLGLDGVYCYQETYHPERYQHYHPRGKKSNYQRRLAALDEIGSSGIRRIGMGVLLGLEDWRVDSYFLASHLYALKKKYWRSKFSVSFPRLQSAYGVSAPPRPVSDKELVQLITAWRLFDEDLDLVLSTREAPAFRDQVFKLGITTMSAGSKTDPGGYACYPAKENLEQFEISDSRTAGEVAQVVSSQGYAPVWKDWDRLFF